MQPSRRASVNRRSARARQTLGIGSPRNLTPAEAKHFEEGLRIFVSRVCSRARTPFSLKVGSLLERRDFASIVKLELDPREYADKSALEFAVDYGVCGFFKKYQDFDLGIDREAAAFQKWLAAEERCRTINALFRSRWDGDSPYFPHHVEEILHLARRKIRDTLGAFDRFAAREMCTFGPGADTGTRGDNTSSYHKFRSNGESTPGAASLMYEWFHTDRRVSYTQDSTLVSASRLSFVPKTALIDRSICVEPRWNVFLQLGIGGLICQRLRRIGLDIQCQADANRRLASRAQADGLATIDLSSASDTVSTNLVLDLFSCVDTDDEEPFSDWLDAILRTRCVNTVYKGERFRLEKISSMGNGYTFPLETLIFFAFAWGTLTYLGIEAKVNENLAVFGDDIIVPKEAASTLIEVLAAVGFTTNSSKTFTEGEFFESCGKDYFRGKDVRPAFHKNAVRHSTEIYNAVNKILDWGCRLSFFADGCPSWIYSLRSDLLRRIPKDLRLLGPRTEASNGHIHVPLDHCQPSRSRRGWETYAITTCVGTAEGHLGYSYRAHLYSKLHGDIDSRNEVIPRGSIRWRLKKDMEILANEFVVTRESPPLLIAEV